MSPTASFLGIPERPTTLGLNNTTNESSNAGQELERCDEPVRHLLRGSSADGRPRLELTYTESLELPIMIAAAG